MLGRMWFLTLLAAHFGLHLAATADQRRNTADIELDDENDAITMTACYVEDLRNIRKNNPNPSTIIINHCYLQELPNAIFIRFADLHTLEICDSRLSNLHDFALNGLRNLEVLNLSRNNLTSIKSWSEYDLEHLQTLDLRKNLLKGINAQSFFRYPNLSKLNLAGNLIHTIPEGTFKVIPNLKFLNLGRNLLTSIEEHTLKGLSKLTHVSFHLNLITFVDYFAFIGNSHLKTLQLQENQISVFEADLLSNLPRLMMFNISCNQLEDIADQTFRKNADLRVLDLSYNRIENFREDSFKGLVSLEVFNASHNHITQLNKYIFKDFSLVRILDLSANRLAYIDNKLFEYSSRLEVLNLSGNALSDIEPNIFEDSKRLRTLDLSHNQLSLDAFLWPVTNLDHLNMSHNQFQQLNVSTLQGLGHVRLNGNPWTCQFLILELMKHSKNVEYGKNYAVVSADSIMNTQGIECMDERGKPRDIIVVENFIQPNYSSTEYQRIQTLHQENVDTRPIQDNFDTKSTILWLMFGVFIVFGAFKLIQLILRHSEHQSEKWRLAQHMDFNEADHVGIEDVEKHRCAFPAVQPYSVSNKGKNHNEDWNQ